MALTLEQIDAEIARRKAANTPKPENESFLDAIIRTPGAAGRMAVGGMASLGGLLADPVGDLVEYATGTPMMPTRDAALSLYDEATGGKYAPRNAMERTTQMAGEFLTGGGATGAAAKALGAAPAIVKSLAVTSPTDALSAISGGLGLGAAQEADLSAPAQMGVSLAASMLPYGARGAGRGLLPKTSREVVNSQLAAGGDITVGGVMGGGVIPRVEAGLAQAPIVGAPIRRAREAVASSLTKRLDDIADATSPEVISSLDDAGQTVRTYVTQSTKNRIGEASKLYDDIFAKIPSDTIADTAASRAILGDLRSKYRYNDKALKFLDDDVLTSLTKGEIPAQELKIMRPQIKDLAESAAKKEGLGSLAKDINRIYTQINDDIKSTAARVVKGSDKEIAFADAKFKAALDLDDRLTRWIGAKGDEALATSFKKLGGAGTAKTAAGANIRVLEDIASVLPDDQIADLSSYMIRTMGRSADGTLNPMAFADEYMSMNPKAKAILFGKTLPKEQRAALDKIAQYAQSSKATLNAPGSGAAILDYANIAYAFHAITSSSNLAMALLPYAISKGLASQTLAKAINKLPRAALERPVSSFKGGTLRNLMLQRGATKEDVEGFINSIGEQNAPNVDSVNSNMGGNQLPLSPSGDAGLPVSPITLDDIEREIQRRKSQIAPQSSITPDFYQKVAQAESGGNPMAKSDSSSASGLYQFTDQTWRDTVKKYGARYGITKDMKNSPYAQEAMVKHLTEENRSALVPKLGREPTHGELYVAHFMGAPKAAKLLDMRGSREIAARVFPTEAKANRPIFFDGKRPRTVQEVIAILERKVS